jgi:hypothetical protein
MTEMSDLFVCIGFTDGQARILARTPWAQNVLRRAEGEPDSTLREIVIAEYGDIAWFRDEAIAQLKAEVRAQGGAIRHHAE